MSKKLAMWGLPALAMILVVVPDELRAEDEWRLASDEDGTRIDVRSVEGSNFPEFRGRRMIAAPVGEIAAVIRESGGYTRWMQDCVESSELAPLAERAAAYQRFDLPWPIQDRDTAFVSEESALSDGVLLFRFEAVEHPDVPVRSGVVRMPSLQGHFRLEPRDGGTFVEYQAAIDPGIALPAWLAESLSTTGPIGTLAGLEREAGEAHSEP